MGGTALPADVVADTDSSRQVESTDGRLGWLRRCPGDLDAAFVWQDPVDPADLIGPAHQRAVNRLPLPVPDMSPAADVGSYVNLGLWFSVDDPGITTARATLGTAWAEVTGRFESVSIDPGDGTGPVTCDGFGVAYPMGSNDPEQGPCGHTYTTTSPDDGFAMAYTTTYSISWRTSDGRAGDLGTYDRTTPIVYHVDEIQTVGAAP